MEIEEEKLNVWEKDKENSFSTIHITQIVLELFYFIY